MKTKAPYAPGDLVHLLHSSAEGATVLGDVSVRRVVPLNDGQHWRIECDRVGGGDVHVIVDRTGRDRNRYAEPVRRSA